MNPLLAATLGIASIDAAISRFQSMLDYEQIESGVVTPELGEALQARTAIGSRTAILRPASKRETYVRLVETPSAPGPALMASIGWTALEICIEDVNATHERMKSGPFEIIGPPSAIAGLPTIHPMQVEGPDGEVIFLTQILTDDPKDGLPVAQAPVDTLFIAVLACRDLAVTAQWMGQQLASAIADPVSIPYRTLSRAFGLPPEHLHTITTASRDGHIFVELDQYPDAAADRGKSGSGLTRGVAMISLLHPNLNDVHGPWIVSPATRNGAIYQGRRTGVVATPEGALVELVEVTHD